MRRRDFIKTPLMAPFLSASLGRAGWPGGPQGQQMESGVRVFQAGEPLRFELQELTNHPFYWWPQTLLSYPVQFDHAKVKASELSLVRIDKGQAIPLQLSEVRSEDGYLKFARVNFISELATGETRRFELTDKPADSRSLRGAETPVSESREGNTIILDSSVVKVRIPDSQEVHGKAPGPLLQISRGGGWFGDSQIVSPKRRVLSITTTREDSGPLFITYRMTYQFEGGAKYIARVKCLSGLDFVQFTEEMEGFGKDEGAYLETRWTGFHPTHRQAPNHPYYPHVPPGEGYQHYMWERIDEPFVNSQHGVSPGSGEEGELPFRLGIYQPWGAYVQLTSANFWDERTNDALGIFIDDVSRWQDHEYAIWTASITLQVRYHYQDGTLWWKWPLVTGTRTTGVVAYDHQKDMEIVALMEQLHNEPKKHNDGFTYRASAVPTSSHLLFLQNRYGTLDLNQFKDWVLEYPETKKRPPVIFEFGQVTGAGALEHMALGSGLASELPTYGTRQNTGFGPVPSRQLYGWWIDGYNRFYSKLNDAQKKRVTAMYLLMAYVHGGEDYMPMKPMLSGHPNFLSDVKSAPALMACLFPEHPMAAEWTDEFEKFVELNTRYHTRPEVKVWEARGGRWTENLGTYVWGFVRPAIHANMLLLGHMDGKNRVTTPQMAQVGEWIVNALSAPFNGEDPKYYLSPNGHMDMHYWGMVTAATGPRRVHPPQGAHSARRMPPRSAWLLGTMLARYRPETAEHLMWAARPTDDDEEHFKTQPDPWYFMYPKKDNRGTNPHLKTCKYTGYGIVLRAAVDTPEEVSLHLQQIDRGPNYRWGVAGEGGNGIIYYYANGKSYSHTALEDAGDRADQDTDFCSNFGVFKDGKFKSIGMNVLDQPLHDLALAQYCELRPRQGKAGYSWPEYVSRSVMLAGKDYFVIYDDVWNEEVAHRFSWFTHVGDELPFLHFVKGGTRDREMLKTEVETKMTKGVWRDGLGDSMVVVTHKSGLDVQRTSYGCQVVAGDATDDVFRDPDGIQFSENGKSFTGTAGFIRNKADGNYELALFHGSRIGVGGVNLTVDDSNLGIGARFKDPAELTGIYFGRKNATLDIELAKGFEETSAFYIDGAKVEMGKQSNKITVKLPAGRHRWQLTSKLPVPDAPVMLRTENHRGGAKVFFSPVAGAAKYRIELSRDNGATWQAAGTTTESSYAVADLENGTKVHVRAVATNDLHEGEPAEEYPIYVSDQAPLPPDGLKLRLGEKKVDLTWGEVLGVTEYRVYRRVKGAGEFGLVYRGPAREFADQNVDVIPAYPEPGQAAALAHSPQRRYTVYEYAVSAANRNGEGAKCVPINTDPRNWTNWEPRPGEGFRRNYTHSADLYMVRMEPLPEYP